MDRDFGPIRQLFVEFAAGIVGQFVVGALDVVDVWAWYLCMDDARAPNF